MIDPPNLRFAANMQSLFLSVAMLFFLQDGLAAAQQNFSGSFFDCPPLAIAEGRPQTDSIRRLSPSDIKVVGALGDSVTAAFGAQATSDLQYNSLSEYRGISWSAGT